MKGNDVHELRYAALELRMCIEVLSYDTIMTYYDQLPITVKRRWKPRDVVAEILQSVPDADKSVTMAVGIENTPGTESKKMVPLGTDHRLDPKWTNETYNRLGSFLHIPTISQIEDGREHDAKKLFSELGKISSRLSEVLDSRIFNVRMDLNTVSFKCNCGFVIRRRSDVLKHPIVCINCGEIYEHQEENGSHKFSVKDEPFACDYCHKESVLRTKSIMEGRMFKCIHCGPEFDSGRGMLAMGRG